MNVSFLLEMALKSSFIAGVALSLAIILKKRSPADRASLLQVGTLLLVLLPLVSLFFPAWQVELAADEAQPLAASLLQLQQSLPPIAEAAPLPAAAAPAASAIALDPALLVALLYLTGLAIAAARLVGGLLTLRRWTAAAEPASCPYWTRALKRVTAAAGRDPVPLLVSSDVPGPLSWGWREPVILIDADAYMRGEDAEAILAHELAHIDRRDWPALMLSRIATALFWFNPLVRLLGRAFVRHAEEAADCQALGHVEPAPYAQALLGCASHASRSLVPANSIASSDLAKRVHAILEGSSRAMPSGSRLWIATILGCVALTGPVSAMKLIPAVAADAAAALAPVAPEAAAMVRAAIAPAPAPAAAAAPVQAAAAPVTIAAAAVKPVAAAPAPVAVAVAQAPAVAAVQVQPVQLAALPVAALATTAAAAQPSDADRRAYDEAMREARAAGAEAARAGERAARASQRAGELARRHARRSMAEGAVSMERGAESMKAGARHMAEEAVRLRDPAYREKQIARRAEHGHVVTHQQLIDAIPQLEKGSRDMLKGVEDMRRGAEQMRRSAEDE